MKDPETPDAPRDPVTGEKLPTAGNPIEKLPTAGNPIEKRATVGSPTAKTHARILYVGAMIFIVLFGLGQHGGRISLSDLQVTAIGLLVAAFVLPRLGIKW